MNSRNLLILTGCTLAILLVTVISKQQREPRTELQRTLVFPELTENVNNVTDIVIENNNGSLTISKQNEQWIVNEANNYPANFDKIKSTILQVRDLRIVSKKTNKPELYSELGVEDPKSDDATSHLLSLKDKSGKDIITTIVGKPRKSSSETQGLYLRIAGSDQALLVQGSLDITMTVSNWIEQNLLNITDDRVKKTIIKFNDGSMITLNRADKEADFSIIDLPIDKEPESSYIINSLGTFLSNLTIENALPRPSVTFTDDRTTTTIETFDGLVATIESEKIDEKNHVAFNFSINEKVLDQLNTEETIAKDEQTTKPSVEQEIAELNEKTANWVYIVSDFEYNTLVKKRDDLMKDVKPDEEIEESSSI